MKLLMMLLSAALAMNLMACSDDDSPAAGDDTPATSTAVPSLKMTCGSNSCIQ